MRPINYEKLVKTFSCCLYSTTYRRAHMSPSGTFSPFYLPILIKSAINLIPSQKTGFRLGSYFFSCLSLGINPHHHLHLSLEFWVF